MLASRACNQAFSETTINYVAIRNRGLIKEDHCEGACTQR